MGAHIAMFSLVRRRWLALLTAGTVATVSACEDTKPSEPSAIEACGFSIEPGNLAKHPYILPGQTVTLSGAFATGETYSVELISHVDPSLIIAGPLPATRLDSKTLSFTAPSSTGPSGWPAIGYAVFARVRSSRCTVANDSSGPTRLMPFHYSGTFHYVSHGRTRFALTSTQGITDDATAQAELMSQPGRATYIDTDNAPSPGTFSFSETGSATSPSGGTISFSGSGANFPIPKGNAPIFLAVHPDTKTVDILFSLSATNAVRMEPPSGNRVDFVVSAPDPSPDGGRVSAVLGDDYTIKAGSYTYQGRNPLDGKPYDVSLSWSDMPLIIPPGPIALRGIPSSLAADAHRH